MQYAATVLLPPPPPLLRCAVMQFFKKGCPPPSHTYRCLVSRVRCCEGTMRPRLCPYIVSRRSTTRSICGRCEPQTPMPRCPRECSVLLGGSCPPCGRHVAVWQSASSVPHHVFGPSSCCLVPVQFLGSCGAFCACLMGGRVRGGGEGCLVSSIISVDRFVRLCTWQVRDRQHD
jgi:hypothetical protein